jgi:DNA processing protein
LGLADAFFNGPLMALDARAEAWARLALLRLPAETAAALLRSFGSAEEIFAVSRARLAAATAPAIAARIAARIDGEVLERTSRWLDHERHEIVAWDDPDYPQQLLKTPDAPAALFFMGRRELLNRPALAIVGSRNATPQGVENAREFARALSHAGLTIVSGLALGIDGAAHEGALEGVGSTIACIGTGPDRVYPPRHRDLAHRIAESGAMLSEFAPGTPPLPHNFPLRNRLISGISRGVLVVEATLSSGSLITARLAGEQSREVFAIPGSIHSPFSRGCHRLIREGAKLVETAQDVLDELQLEGIHSAPPSGELAMAHVPALPIHRAVVAALGGDPCDLDTLISRTELAADALAATLVELELDGRVAALPGGRWQRIG